MNDQYKFTNNLIHESSPYLLQHAHNPVNWYPWGEEALEKAKKENKLIIISIGYAACHWCHVMEKESFEDESVANFMNEHFLSIKVDREERPDIDQIYLNAVQLLTGRGGWPLNCVALPDGRPVYGGTYFQKNQWFELLSSILNFANEKPQDTLNQANLVAENVQNNELIISSSDQQSFSISDLEMIFSKWKDQIDFEYGGQKGAPKFPLPVGHQFLLHYYHLTNDEDAKTAVLTSLNKMAFGGIYDQIGGGFARYSTDKLWKVPHFEKMLYDNAQLVSLHCSAFQLTKNQLYKSVVEETLEFVQRELARPDGGFYSSLDADSEGIEGKYYVWNELEIIDILGDNAQLIIDYYNITSSGNWEESNNILYRSENESDILKKYNLSSDKLNEIIYKSKKLLLESRNKKIRPALDDKILTSWNGLMIKAFADAYRVLGKSSYIDIAIKNVDFILKNLKTSENRLYRNFKNGKATINAFLDDYAFLIEALIQLYRATFNRKWLDEAMLLTNYCIEHFYDSESNMFFYTSDIDPALIARKMELSDNVVPSSNSTMAKNMYLLGHYFYEDQLIEKSRIMLSNVKENIADIGVYGANWDILMAWFADEPFEISIVGEDYDKLKTEIESYFSPNIILSGGKLNDNLPVLEGKFVEDETLIYICKNKACYRPVNTVREVLNFFGKYKD